MAEPHTGAMIALIPSDADLDRLTVEHGEAREDLHLTVLFLGAAEDYDDTARKAVVNSVTALVEMETPGVVVGRAFGVAHWNPDGEEPCWVLNVGDDPDADTAGLEEVLGWAGDAVLIPEAVELVPPQHTPWSPHICLIYTEADDLTAGLTDRVGPVNFDRLRVAFGDDITDIPLADAVTAAGSPRRELTDAEIASTIDFATHQTEHEAAVEKLATEWKRLAAAQRRELAQQIIAAVDDNQLDRLADLAVDSEPAAKLLQARMMDLARRAAEAAAAEAARQGVDVAPPPVDIDVMAETALITAALLARAQATTAGQVAMRAAGEPDVDGAEVAREVTTHLESLSDRYVRDQLAAAASMAQNNGRFAVLARAPDAELFASEYLDRNCCKPCRDVDGRAFATLAAAQHAYPAGKYRDCKGGPRCRGTVVAVWSRPVRAMAASGVDGTMTANATLDLVDAGDGNGAAAVTESSPGHLPGPGEDTPTEGEAMPWHKVHGHADCPDGKPWAVVKDDDGEVEGCHESEGAADDQLAALYASEEGEADMTVTAEEDQEFGGDPKPGTKPDQRLKENRRKAKKKMAVEVDETADGPLGAWSGVLTMEGVETGDGREFAADALTWDTPPLPLMWQKETSHGGGTDVSVRVGSVLHVWRDGQTIRGSGCLDLGVADDGSKNADAWEAYRRMQGGFLNGNSVDVDSVKEADVEFVFPEADADEAKRDGDDGDVISVLFGPAPEKMIFHKGRIRGTTLVEFPAFTEARVALSDDGSVEVPQIAATATMSDESPAADVADLALVADASLQWRPPAAWFEDPKLTELSPIVVTDDGHVFGHATDWISCHIGRDDTCTRAPREHDHPYFMTGEIPVDDGTTVPVGQITAGIGHAPLYWSPDHAAEHYDNTESVVADVRVGNDKYGIWVAGAIRPFADPRRVHALRASGQVSPDWRRMGAQLRMVALLTVNVSGYQIPKSARVLVASGAVMTMIGPGVSADRCGCAPPVSRVPAAMVSAGVALNGKTVSPAAVDKEALLAMRDRLAERMGRVPVADGEPAPEGTEPLDGEGKVSDEVPVGKVND